MKMTFEDCLVLGVAYVLMILLQIQTLGVYDLLGAIGVHYNAEEPSVVWLILMIFSVSVFFSTWGPALGLFIARSLEHESPRAVALLLLASLAYMVISVLLPLRDEPAATWIFLIHDVILALMILGRITSPKPVSA